MLLGWEGFAAETQESLETFSGFLKVETSVNRELLSQGAGCGRKRRAGGAKKGGFCCVERLA